MQTRSGNIVDILNQHIFYGTITYMDKRILSVASVESTPRKGEPYIMPGFVDAHVHVESSLLVPSEFAKMAVVHGTVATISDPHEIANVCGMEGVQFMIQNGKTVPFKFHFGAPSCVPATTFETAGDEITVQDVDALLQHPDIFYLSEMMNFPGVLNHDEAVMQKIALAKKYGKPVDGHAPGLRGKDAARYIAAGISTDHECFTLEEAEDKLQLGMKILIREGSAAKNFDALIPLLHHHADHMMFCSDDKHPDSLLEGHINQLYVRAIQYGIDPWKALRAACVNPVLHYNMQVGLLRPNDAADFIVVNNLQECNVLETVINGETVAQNGKSLISTTPATPINRFECNPLTTEQLRINADNQPALPVIGALNGQLITEKLSVTPRIENGCYVADTKNDILKIAVINRYHPAPPAVAFIKNFDLKHGAMASSVAHDSHNLVVVGTSDEDMCRAVNLLIENRGGLSAVDATSEHVLPLPVAGLMSHQEGYQVAATYTTLDQFVKNKLGSTLTAPFMTLSFMALLVIPHLKLSDQGLFDGDQFKLL
ncbi:MAG TPA: adenine deaminase [Ferruginibacter sp.]|nr:adenine deaminase [Ferruginibacter sp.]HRO18086.1 adenine deaminase [Ferruginibacter sp.]HRQ21137.1 adenine deaminase [Ferruginibacter sp.]